MTVEQLLDSITSAELAEWQAYYGLEPFGESWRQSATVCAMVGNAAGGKKKGGSFTPDDFLPAKPKSGPRKIAKQRMSSEQMLKNLKMYGDHRKPERQPRHEPGSVQQGIEESNH